MATNPLNSIQNRAPYRVAVQFIAAVVLIYLTLNGWLMVDYFLRRGEIAILGILSFTTHLWEAIAFAAIGIVLLAELGYALRGRFTRGDA